MEIIVINRRSAISWCIGQWGQNECDTGDCHAGRPADVQPLLDGSLLISDDLAGAVYQVTYNRSSVPDGS